ncbi:MAG: hypothetical protein ACOX18_03415 [Bacillota bacterium]|jgi:hypothetical protein
MVLSGGFAHPGDWGLISIDRTSFPEDFQDSVYLSTVSLRYSTEPDA